MSTKKPGSIDRAEWLEEFNRRITEWLRTSYGDTVKYVTDVRADGTDWAGDTEDGFYTKFDLRIRWVHIDGRNRYTTVAGEDLESLWRHVVAP